MFSLIVFSTEKENNFCSHDILLWILLLLPAACQKHCQESCRLIFMITIKFLEVVCLPSFECRFRLPHRVILSFMCFKYYSALRSRFSLGFLKQFVLFFLLHYVFLQCWELQCMVIRAVLSTQVTRTYLSTHMTNKKCHTWMWAVSDFADFKV